MVAGMGLISVARSFSILYLRAAGRAASPTAVVAPSGKGAQATSESAGVERVLGRRAQVESVVVRDEVDCEAEVAEPARAADAMEVGLAALGEVEVDDDIDRRDVDATGEQIWGRDTR